MDSEMTTLNGTLSEFRAELAGLRAELHGLAEQLRSYVSSNETRWQQFYEEYRQARQPQYGVIASWAGVALTFLIAIGGLVTYMIGEKTAVHAAFIDKLDARTQTLAVASATQAEALNTVAQATEHNQQLIRELDDKLQKEMTGIDARLKTELENLDTRTQREVNLLLDALRTEQAATKETLHRILSWQDDHDKRVLGLNAAQWERIRALERAVFGKADSIQHGAPAGAGFDY